MAKTTIEWTWRRTSDGLMIPGYTRNVVWGCVPVSPGCGRCYAKRIAKRMTKQPLWGPKAGRLAFGDAYWREPLKWNKEASLQGHRRNVFCSSMADTFEDHPIVEQERQLHLWPTIEQTPWLNWLLLTKRPENMLTFAPWQGAWRDNVWAMTSVENQHWANIRVPLLLEVEAVVHGLSVEPQLERVDLSPWLDWLQWVIVGGESGPGFRPIDIAWVRFLRDQCVEAGVPFFFKQWGGIHHSAGGRLLDGREWNEMPPEVCTCRTPTLESEVLA
jgi:protein gp37